jgi:hypothetical protein
MAESLNVTAEPTLKSLVANDLLKVVCEWIKAATLDRDVIRLCSLLQVRGSHSFA